MRKTAGLCSLIGSLLVGLGCDDSVADQPTQVFVPSPIVNSGQGVAGSTAGTSGAGAVLQGDAGEAAVAGFLGTGQSTGPSETADSAGSSASAGASAGGAGGTSGLAGSQVASGGASAGSDDAASAAGGRSGTAGSQAPATGSDEPVANGAGVDEGSASQATAQPTALAFAVTTTETGGRYGPRNCGAIWVEDADGEWVTTLAAWVRIRQRYLNTFNARADGEVTDATTSATLRNHETHEVSWDLTDGSGARVPDGDYTVWVETTEGQFGGGPTLQVDFTVGPEMVRVSPSDEMGFRDVALTLE